MGESAATKAGFRGAIRRIGRAQAACVYESGEIARRQYAVRYLLRLRRELGERLNYRERNKLDVLRLIFND